MVLGGKDKGQFLDEILCLHTFIPILMYLSSA